MILHIVFRRPDLYDGLRSNLVLSSIVLICVSFENILFIKFKITGVLQKNMTIYKVWSRLFDDIGRKNVTTGKFDD